MFVDELIELMELNPIRDAIVGLPGVDGLSIEQRKRLTIAVELVANPSIIFLDEPTSGLDQKLMFSLYLNLLMRCVAKNLWHKWDSDSLLIFILNMQLLLMKMGGQIVYAGPLGQHSHNLVEYFEVSFISIIWSFTVIYIFCLNIHTLLCITGYFRTTKD